MNRGKSWVARKDPGTPPASPPTDTGTGDADAGACAFALFDDEDGGRDMRSEIEGEQEYGDDDDEADEVYDDNLFVEVDSRGSHPGGREEGTERHSPVRRKA